MASTVTTYAATSNAAPHSKNAAQRNRSNSPYQQRTSQRDNPTQQLIKQAVDYLIQQLEAGKSETLTAYLNAMAQFHSYSFGNILQIARQKPDATRVAFLAYCLQVTLKNRLMIHAPGLTPMAVLDKLAAIQMIDVHIPTLDGRWLILPRYTQPETAAKIVLEKLHLVLPTQPPPRITAHPVAS